MHRLSILPLLVFCACDVRETEGDDELVTGSSELTGALPVGTLLTTSVLTRLRATPSSSGALVLTIPAGEQVILVENVPSAGWYHIDWKGTRGWSYGGFLKRLASDGGTDAGVADAGVPHPHGPPGLDLSVHVALGLPDVASVGRADRWLLVHPQFVTSYDTTRKTPNWSAWKLDVRDLGRATRARTYTAEPMLPLAAQAHNVDFERTGFDRGHLCPAADRTATDLDNDATFVLSNIVPQTHENNVGPWAILEDEERRQAVAGKTVVIVAGPVFGATRQTIGAGVEVPTAVFKVAVMLNSAASPDSVNATTRIYAAIIPNTHAALGNWRQYQVTVREVERQTRLDFLSDLPQATQDVLENRLDP